MTDEEVRDRLRWRPMIHGGDPKVSFERWINL